MDDPLENNENNCPQKEVCDPKPGETLIKKKPFRDNNQANEIRKRIEIETTMELQLTKRFKTASPNKNTALIVCIFIINCHKNKKKKLTSLVNVCFVVLA